MLSSSSTGRLNKRYEAIRQQLNEFAQSFQELARQQEALPKRTDELLKDYRKKAPQRYEEAVRQYYEELIK